MHPAVLGQDFFQRPEGRRSLRVLPLALLRFRGALRSRSHLLRSWTLSFLGKTSLIRASSRCFGQGPGFKMRPTNNPNNLFSPWDRVHSWETTEARPKQHPHARGGGLRIFVLRQLKWHRMCSVLWQGDECNARGADEYVGSLSCTVSGAKGHFGAVVRSSFDNFLPRRSEVWFLAF